MGSIYALNISENFIGDIIVDLLNEEIYLNEEYSESDAKKLIDKMLQDIYE